MACSFDGPCTLPDYLRGNDGMPSFMLMLLGLKTSLLVIHHASHNEKANGEMST